MAMIAVLTVSSCESENPASRGEEYNVTVGIPDPMDNYSKASASDAFSHLGGALNVDPAEFDLRYIVEVWSKDDSPELLYREIKTVDGDFAVTPVSFGLKLEQLPCYLVFWADFVREDMSEDLHYVTEGNLQNIRYSDDISSAGDLASDDMDAYCAVELVESVSLQSKRKIVLKRPFGKLRLLATDIVDSGELEPAEPKWATIDFKNIQFANTYNVLTDRAGMSGDTRSAGKFDFKVIKENALAGKNIYDNVYLLGFDYFFVADQIPSYSMDVTVYGDEDRSFALGTKNLSGIPVVSGKLTTVIGDFYSNSGTVNVIVDDAFDNDEKVEN